MHFRHNDLKISLEYNLQDKTYAIALLSGMRNKFGIFLVQYARISLRFHNGHFKLLHPQILDLKLQKWLLVIFEHRSYHLWYRKPVTYMTEISLIVTLNNQFTSHTLV